MADARISALTAATTPLSGTEVLPIVQSGATKKVSVDNLTVGKTVTGLNFLASQSSPTGVTGLTLRNDSQAATAGKYSQLKFSGYDTVGTLKDNAYLREVPADDNCVGASLEVWVKASDTIFKTATFDTGGNYVFAVANKGLLFSGNSNVVWRCGAGTPEGAVTAPVGSLYTRTDGGANTTLYVKESGAGNTGWVAK